MSLFLDCLAVNNSFNLPITIQSSEINMSYEGGIHNQRSCPIPIRHAI